jgi:glycosyltransferase involved in cell wall biosynthesis
MYPGRPGRERVPGARYSSALDRARSVDSAEFMNQTSQPVAAAAPQRPDARALRVLLVGEGDLSHGSFLRRVADGLVRGDDSGALTTDVRVVEAPRGVEARLIASVPPLGDLDLQPLRWRLRYSWRARQLLGAGAGGADVAFVNTQSCALLAAAPMRRVPTVISVDVTGRQFAALEYWRPRGRTARVGELPLEALERRALRSAAAVLAWTAWTARSLRDDYGVAPERIATIHPGVDVAQWDVERPAAPSDGPLRILFVGNYAWRKGLKTLLSALPLVERPVELHVVTGDEDVDPPEPNVVVHRGLAPGSDELRRRFAEADVFAFPTRADAVPWVVAEAMAAGLPVVASDVAAISEMVGDAGLVVPRDDASALAAALRELADAPERRVALGALSRASARARFDQERQLGRITDLLRRVRRAHVEDVTS